MKILITGGGDGLGYELSKYYLENSNQVTILDIKQTEKLKKSKFIKFNLEKFSENQIKKLNKYDLVICNAGISLGGNFVKQTKEQNKKVLEINLLGHIELIRQLLFHKKINPKGRIAFINSASVFLPWPVALSYSASKAGLDGFAHALESYLTKKEISITRVYPGPMKTNHSKYYKGISENKGNNPAKLAKIIAKSIQKRKRKVLPDTASKIFYFSSKLFPRTISKSVYKKYQEHLKH